MVGDIFTAKMMKHNEKPQPLLFRYAFYC